jgi:hypothetical protein
VWDRESEYTYGQLEELAVKAEPFKTLIGIDAPEFLNPVDLDEDIDVGETLEKRLAILLEKYTNQ